MLFHDEGEAQARLYFLDLLQLFLGLIRAKEDAVAAILAVAQDYRDQFPRCRLVLRPKVDTRLKEARGLYWGKILPEPSSARSSDRGKVRQIVHHLKGPLRDDWVYQIAKLFSRIDHFRDFERRREAAQGARRVAVRAIDSMRKVILAKYPEPAAPLEIPSPCPEEAIRREMFPACPSDLLPRDLDPRTRKALLSGWRMVYSIALAEREVGMIARSVAANAVVGPYFRLQFLDRDECRPFQETRWINLISTVAYPSLSEQVMEEIRLPLDTRPVLRVKETRRQLLLKWKQVHVRIHQSLKDLAAPAHLEAGRRLAEASLSCIASGPHLAARAG